MADRLFKFGNLKEGKGQRCDVHNKRCGYVKGQKLKYSNVRIK